MLKKMKYPIIWHILCGVLTAIVGIWLNDNEVILQYHIQTSVLGITVIYLGYLFQHYRQYMMKYLQWWLSPILGIVIWKILSLNIGMVELSANMILHPLIFYPITILGITFCICIARGDLIRLEYYGHYFVQLEKIAIILWHFILLLSNVLI